jgi:hypothetical protein
MSLDKMLRDVVRDEVLKAFGPLAAAVKDLQSQGAVVARLASALGTPLKRGVGRPVRVAAGKRGRKAAVEGAVCAVVDCGRPARSKGYCAAHYQKFRMLQKTDRLPSDWKEYAEPNSVENISLPRGRAGAKALAEVKKR